MGLLSGGAPKWLTKVETDLKLLLDGASYKVYWINADKRLIIHTDRVDDSLYAAVADVAAVYMPADATLEQYNHNIEVSWRDINKYAHCKTRADMVAVNPEFANDLTSEGEWVYLLPNFEDSQTNHPNNFWTYEDAAFPALKQFCVPLPKLKNGKSFFSRCSNLVSPQVYEFPELVETFLLFGRCASMTFLKLVVPKVTNLWQIVWQSQNLRHVVIVGDNITVLKATFGELKNIEIVECNTSKVQDAQLAFCYAPNLKEFPLEYPSLTNAPRMFEGNTMTGQQAITVLNSIPAYTSGTHNITMGIHIDYQTDADVLAAIDNAAAKGWTVTVQWNGTPTSTASTFGFKRVWVRKTKDAEFGRYLDANGIRWSVEWCDSISAPDGSAPDAHGYELYRSVDAAVAYWELAEYEQEEF